MLLYGGKAHHSILPSQDESEEDVRDTGAGRCRVLNRVARIGLDGGSRRHGRGSCSDPRNDRRCTAQRAVRQLWQAEAGPTSKLQHMLKPCKECHSILMTHWRLSNR